ncbi:T9SS type A sorting domain-containing protein [Rubrivirga sp.]|uniref:T9SS type A sorting domain-containing protein n=1 Tax=Rubrivirga sp. TaxID=1885344 RepID=UPI003C714AC4
MNRFVTLLALVALTAPLALAQHPARTNNGVFTDQVFARDIGAADITLDGTLDEPEWANAETLTLQQGESDFWPGGGWQIQEGPATDPSEGTLRLLRKGNMIYVGLEVADESIGGSRNFFQHDGLVMSMSDERRRDEDFARADTSFQANYFGIGNQTEFFYTWLNRGVGGLEAGADSVGQAPTVNGNINPDRGSPDERIDTDVLEVSYTIDGVANDDFNGNATPTEDVGYVMEFSINAETLGFDLDSGEPFPITFALYDLDYAWPSDENLRSRNRAWFQNPFGNNFNFGVSYVVGDPSVTVSSGAVPATDPDLTVPEGSVVVDGRLDEDVWNTDAAVSLQYMMTEEQLDALPGVGPHYSAWFRPGADENVPVVDASTGDFRFAYEGTTLYVALDSDDAAISGQTRDEARFDGFRLILRDLSARDNMGSEADRFEHLQFAVVVDSTGAATLLQSAAADSVFNVTAAAFLKGTSTAADPSDIDEGYSIEMSIDLADLGINRSRGVFWVGANYFDGDDLDPAENSYGTRTWWLTERGVGPTARAFLDGSMIVSNETDPAGDEVLRALGNAPNPFSATTQVRYELARASTVTIEVYDVLGRNVQTIEAGLQTPGDQTATVDASALSAGSYIYRVRLDDGTSVSGQMLVIR